MRNKVESPFGEVIYAYTRTQALADGILIDVSETAKSIGFKILVAVSRAVWEKYIEWTDEDTDKQVAQDESGRLRNVLRMLMFAIKQDRKGVYPLIYQLLVIPRNGKSRTKKRVKLKASIHVGDEGEPVITIMLPTED
jgi:hypothetical protein